MTGNNELLKKLSALGFPLFETEEAQDANETLADVVRSKELRLREGFPVVLANTAEKGLFSYETVKRYLKKTQRLSVLGSLTAMSLALYRALGLSFSWTRGLYNSLPAEKKKEYDNFLKKLKEGEDVKVERDTMSAQRLKTVFNRYFNNATSRVGDLLNAEEELGLEYALSQVFSPKQKELVFKKLRREKFTKTEKEYYSRVVRKKVLALVNPELHRLAQKLL